MVAGKGKSRTVGADQRQALLRFKMAKEGDFALGVWDISLLWFLVFVVFFFFFNFSLSCNFFTIKP